MYVCLCHAINDRQVKQAVQEGMCNLRQVQLCLRVGTKCGKCIPAARELVKDALRESAIAVPPPERPQLRIVSSR